MPFVHKEGKDTIIFASKEDHATPSKIDLPEPEPSPGLLLASGEINWNCPCLGVDGSMVIYCIVVINKLFHKLINYHFIRTMHDLIRGKIIFSRRDIKFVLFVRAATTR